jgi:hypothetical protein
MFARFENVATFERPLQNASTLMTLYLHIRHMPSKPNENINGNWMDGASPSGHGKRFCPESV